MTSSELPTSELPTSALTTSVVKLWHFTILRKRNRYSKIPPNAKNIISYLKRTCIDSLRFSCTHQITFGYEPSSSAEGDVIIHVCFKSEKTLKNLRAALYRHFENVQRGEMTCNSEHAKEGEEFFRLALAFEPVYKACVGFGEETLKKMHADAKAEQEVVAAMPKPVAPYKPRSKKAQTAFVQLAARMNDINDKVDALEKRGNRMEQKFNRILAWIDSR